MTDKNTNTGHMNALAKTIVQINRANGWDVAKPSDWNDPQKLAAVLALIHSEVSEALEAVRHKNYDNFKEELADTLIRLLDLTGGLGIDIDSAVLRKLAINETRGYKHGGKAI